MATAGGFTATKLALARDILKEMFQQFDDSLSEDGSSQLNWLSFPACLCATGTRGFFVEALKRKRFNVVVTTCGTLDHDIARSFSDYYHGAFELDDVEPKFYYIVVDYDCDGLKIIMLKQRKNEYNDLYNYMSSITSCIY